MKVIESAPNLIISLNNISHIADFMTELEDPVIRGLYQSNKTGTEPEPGTCPFPEISCHYKVESLSGTHPDLAGKTIAEAMSLVLSISSNRIQNGAMHHLKELRYHAEDAGDKEAHETKAFNTEVASGCAHCRKAAALCLQNPLF